MKSAIKIGCAQAILLAGIALSTIGASVARGADPVLIGYSSGNAKIVPRQGGGAFVIWTGSFDANGTFDALRIAATSSAGAVDPAWPDSGAALDRNAWAFSAESDGVGGVYVAWAHMLGSGVGSIRLGRFTESGAPSLGWPDTGLVVAASTNTQGSPHLSTDESGSVFVEWAEPSDQCRLSRFLPSGVRATGWPASGLLVPRLYGVSLVGCGSAGGLIVAGLMTDPSSNFIAGAIRYLADGSIAPGWPANALAIPTIGLHPVYLPAACPDGAGGAIVAWTANGTEAYATRVTATGSLGPGWPNNGLRIAGFGVAPSVAADGAGGAFFTWQDFRPGVNVYLQRVSGSGLATFPDGGVQISALPYNSLEPMLTPDGFGGVFIAWHTVEDGTILHREGRVTRIASTGVPYTGWPGDGLLIDNAPSTPGSPTPVVSADSEGGPFLAWPVERSPGLGGTMFWHLLPDGSNPSGLLVVTNAVGRGAVARSPNSSRALPGTPMTLTAVPLPGDRFVAWSGDTTAVSDTFTVVVGRPLTLVATFERDPAAAPNLTAIADVLGDEGAHVRVQWQPSPIDTGAVPGWLRCYQIQQRQVSPPGAPWAATDSVAAASLSSYSHIVTTPADSTLSDPAVFRYRVVAQANADTAQWASNEVNGYSVDNLAPPAPASVSGVISSGFASLSWPAVSVQDLAHYAVYRGLEALPPTDASHLTGTTTATTYNDTPGYFAHYRVTALDVHGNESPGTLFVPFNPADVPGRPAPKVLSVGNPSPSPMARSMSMTLGLPRAMTATVDVLDSQGRLVRRLCEGEKPAGWITLSWDGRDVRGHDAAAGVYFVRVQMPEARSTKRLVLIP